MAVLESSTAPTPQGGDSYDAIAELLAGTDENVDDNKKNDSESDGGVDGDDSTAATGDDAGADSDSNGDERTDENDTGADELSSWGAALGIDDSKVVLDDDTGALKGFVVKVGEETAVVDVPTLIKGYQTDKYNTQRSQQIAEQKREVEEKAASIVENYTKKLDDAAKLTEMLHNNLLQEYRSIDWDTLRIKNPAEFAALRQEFAEKSDNINQLFGAIETQREQEQSQVQVAQQQQRQQFIASQIELTIEKNPDWASPEAFKSNLDSMTQFFNEAYGIPPDAILGIADHRIVEIYKDAKKGREGAKALTNKMPKPIPKMLKPTGMAKRPVSKVDSLSKAAKNAVGAKKRDLEATAIASLLLGE